MISRFLIDNPSIQSALPTLLDAALKGAILVLVAAGAAYLLRKRSASSRHALWTAAVIGHLAIPLLVLILPAWTMPVLPPAPWMTGASAPSTLGTFKNTRSNSAGVGTASPIGGAAATSKGNATVPAARNAAGNVKSATATGATPGASAPATTPEGKVAGGPVPLATTTPRARPGILPVLATIWFVGALLVLLRLAIGTWRVGQLAREGARVEDGVWLSLAQRLANRLGVTRPLILLRGERLAVPVTWGIVYPAVLLPQDSDSWTEERRRFVLVHEMAHVKRFDALTQLVAQITLAVFWFDPLVWVAAHQMRVEREHACDDYVLRDGTAPSLYAGELLEMVRSIGTPSHDRAAPAFAALAMARRSEFEGRMLAILDPRLDRQTLQKRGTLMTAIIVALLTIPLAAVRPFQQPVVPSKPAAEADALPLSFKVSFSDASAKPASPASQATGVAQAQATISSPARSCDSYPTGTSKGSSTHIDTHGDGDGEILEFLISTVGRCTEAVVRGKAVYSPDETHVAQLSPGGFAKFRERSAGFDRAVSITPVGDGSLSYAATVDGRTTPFDAPMQAWLSHLLPEVLREAAINVPARVARLRAQGGVPAVLQSIAQTHSSWSKRVHYEELIKHGPMLSESDAEKIAQQVGRDLSSSGDLSAVLQMLPLKAIQSPGTRSAIADALSHIASSGDKSSTLQVMAPNADPEMLLMLAKAAETLPSSGDKENFLISTAAEYLAGSNESLTSAYFRAAATIQSSGDMANVLISAIPYGHGNPGIALEVVETSKGLASSGDAANVLISLASQRVLTPNTSRATLSAIQRTLTMASSGDRANVLMEIAGANLLSTSEVRDAYTKAALALPSEGDAANALAAAARRR
jgi:beta-lactamase regulating signal transducer with metallopeptidase domain